MKNKKHMKIGAVLALILITGCSVSRKSAINVEDQVNKEDIKTQLIAKSIVKGITSGFVSAIDTRL